MSKLCTCCGAGDARFLCSMCKRARYCDAECQKKDWTAHKAVCLGRTVTLEQRRAMIRIYHRAMATGMTVPKADWKTEADYRNFIMRTVVDQYAQGEFPKEGDAEHIDDFFPVGDYYYVLKERSFTTIKKSDTDTSKVGTATNLLLVKLPGNKYTIVSTINMTVGHSAHVSQIHTGSIKVVNLIIDNGRPCVVYARDGVQYRYEDKHNNTPTATASVFIAVGMFLRAVARPLVIQRVVCPVGIEVPENSAVGMYDLAFAYAEGLFAQVGATPVSEGIVAFAALCIDEMVYFAGKNVIYKVPASDLANPPNQYLVGEVTIVRERGKFKLRADSYVP